MSRLVSLLVVAAINHLLEVCEKYRKKGRVNHRVYLVAKTARSALLYTSVWGKVGRGRGDGFLRWMLLGGERKSRLGRDFLRNRKSQPQTGSNNRKNYDIFNMTY